MKLNKYIDKDGKILYKENGFNFENNRIADINIEVIEVEK